MAAAPGNPSFGFIGLGAMGYPMASNLAGATGTRVFVWNRTPEVAARHAASPHSNGATTTAVPTIESLQGCTLVALCLPTSAVSEKICERLASLMDNNSIILDHTSGSPLEAQGIADRVRELSSGKVTYIDAPVSGGPAGAAAGTLTTMVGCKHEFASGHPALTTALNAVAKRIVFLDKVGAGNAVKCINNFMNVSHLALASECLYGLGLAGVNVMATLDAINGSSGRSLQTEVRLPTQVLNGKYAYGFDLSLMLKDVRQARAFLRKTFTDRNTHIPEEDLLLPQWGKGLVDLLVAALERDACTNDSSASGDTLQSRSSDYTRSVARYFEGANLPGIHNGGN